MRSASKILHVLNYYAPHTSGLTEYARLVAERLALLGHDVTVLAARHQDDLPAREVLRGVKVIRATPLLRLHKGVLSVDFVRLYARLMRDADIVHLHLPMLESGLLARITPAAVPLAVTYQCDLAPARSWSAMDRLAIAAVRASCRVACRRALKVFVTSKEYACGSPVIGDLPDKWVEVYPPDNAPHDLAPRGQPSGPDKTIGFLGRFVEEKGIDVILDAIPRVLERYPNARFILAGDHASVAGGSLMHKIRERLQGLRANVVTPGKLREDELFAFYRSLDLLLLPSVNAYEAFGIVQIEAMKSGVPVIVSDLRGVRVPVRLTGCGTIVPPGDAPALAEAINHWLSGRVELAPREIAARAWEKFSNARAIEAICRVYSEISERQQDNRAAERGQ